MSNFKLNLFNMLPVKTLKFDPELEQSILDRKKTATWRLNDEKDISVGDFVLLVTGSRIFAKAWIEEVFSKPFAELTKKDKEGHERYRSNVAMYKWFSDYYGMPVDKDTIVKVIRFILVS
jgi:hypothetical protein